MEGPKKRVRHQMLKGKGVHKKGKVRNVPRGTSKKEKEGTVIRKRKFKKRKNQEVASKRKRII